MLYLYCNEASSNEASSNEQKIRIGKTLAAVAAAILFGLGLRIKPGDASASNPPTTHLISCLNNSSVQMVSDNPDPGDLSGDSWDKQESPGISKYITREFKLISKVLSSFDFF